MDPSLYNFQQSPLMSPNVPSLPNSPPNSLMPPNSPPYPTSPNSLPKSPLMPPNLPPKSPLMPPNLPPKSPLMAPSISPRSPPGVPPSPSMHPNLPPKSPYMPSNLPPKSPYMPSSLSSKSPYTSPTLSPSNSISYSMSPLMPPSSTFSKSPLMSPNPYAKSDTSPLTILIETEEEYLADLKSLLQRVTTCWNNENPPPKKLDNMFCLIDKVYKENRELFHKLNKIKQDPQSTESFVDILMNWIDKMEKPYTTYCQGYIRGIESLPEIEGNITLQQTLNDISSEKNQLRTLESFFELPLKRIHYYKKFYSRQLRNSEPGSSDNMNFTNAIQRIDSLIEVAKRARCSQNSNDLPTSPTNQPSAPSDNSQVDMDHPGSPGSPVKKIVTLSELELCLDTTRTIDFITLKTKQIKIDLLPPRLPFNRELILDADFTIVNEDYESDSSPNNFVRAHLFLLTDLLLVCQQLSPEEKEINPNKEFNLMHPPFSGRHLSINDNYDGKEELIRLNFTQKKDLVILTENREQKEMWLRELNRMINFTIQAAKSRPPTNSGLNIYGQQNLSNTRLSIPQNPPSPQTPLIKKSLSTGNLPGDYRLQPPAGSHMSHPNYGQNELNVTQYERFPRTASTISQDNELKIAQRFPRTTSMRSQERLREVEHNVTRLSEAKCKVFLQKDHGVWKNFGWGDMTLDLESPSRNKRIIINIDKPKISRFVDAIISESGVQKTGKCKVAITVSNERSPVPSIYLMQMKDDTIAKKVYDDIRNS
ncbi:5060_t:CDS:10 [Cetraspora pellucida]|uniref:5060_t:CDS:1 n=1 Tax=Cetraspora pellucida TaxID=1433469 RepID=A0ACA9KIN1_9GLOM|nr:5060_t:CDS:10 [Cetraspora pellucida]